MNLDEHHIFGAHGNYRIDYVNNPKKKTAVKFQDITKRYRDYESDKQKLLMLFSKRLRRNISLDTHLDKVTLTINKGEYVNICGSFPNPRVTFCNLTRGSVYPDFGHLWINGKVASIMAMKSEFVLFLSVEENIRRISKLNQVKPEDTTLIFEQVLDFAGISKRKAKLPMKKLTPIESKRLRASYYLHAPYDILIMDANIPIINGDFTEQCDARLKKMLNKDAISVIHPSIAPITSGKFVTRTLLFGEDKPIFDGDVKQSMEIYERMKVEVLTMEEDDDEDEDN
jgi:ABC-type polysaccharide/polyol phosphate transport system ATPase subunit